MWVCGGRSFRQYALSNTCNRCISWRYDCFAHHGYDTLAVRQLLGVMDPFYLMHQITTETAVAADDDKRGLRRVSSAWYVFFSFIHIVYCTNVYLQLDVSAHNS